MAVQVSPTKYAPPDWHTSNAVIQSTAERQRKTTHDVRQQSNRARNETDITTRWTQHENDSNLHNRISDLYDWKDTIKRTLSDIEQEIDALTHTKRNAEYTLESKEMPHQVAIDCLVVREGRIAIDSVRDDVEAELNKELEVISGIYSLLHQRVNEAFEQICVLQGCHRQLAIDLSDKHSAISIDSDCVDLTNESSDITMHSDPTKIKKGIVTPEQWLAYSSHNTRQANEEMGKSVRLRETINHTIQQTTNDLESQWTATNYALRRRVHEVQQTKQELEWQKKNTEEEISKIQKEIGDLEQALNSKVPPMMVAQTRLENRTYRPNVELCRDKPQYELVEEVAEIAISQKQIDEKLKLACLGLGSLERTLDRIKNDLGIKTNSLELDKQCLAIREILSQHPKPQDLLKLVAEQKAQ